MKRLTRVSLKYATVPAVAVAILSSGESRAQEAGTSISLEEIVVTATRREERLQDVPLAVSALSAEQIAASGYKELSDIQYALPGVYFGTTPNDAGFRLRGVGTAGGFSSSSEQNVGTIVDGVVIPIGNPVQSLGDIERIEVLKGPQGTQFGKNASSGIVSVTTRAPNLQEVEGNVFASYGQLSERDVHASVSVPLGDTVAAALYAFDKEFDGFVDNNVLNKEWGGSQTSGARAKLLWQPSDTFSAYLIGDYSKSKLEGPGQLWTLNRLPATFDPFFNPPFVNLTALGVTPGFDNEVAVEEYDSQGEQQNYGGSLELTLSLGGGTLTSITAYRESEGDPSTFAIDGSPLPRFRAQAYGNESNFTSQEIRWTSPSRSDVRVCSRHLSFSAESRSRRGAERAAASESSQSDESDRVHQQRYRYCADNVGKHRRIRRRFPRIYGYAATDCRRALHGRRCRGIDLVADRSCISPRPIECGLCSAIHANRPEDRRHER